MDRKREMTSVDLAALVGELQEYTGAMVDKAYLYGDDFIRIKLRHYDRGRVELLIEVGDIKRAHVADPDHVADAPGRPPNFAMMLRNRIAGATLENVEQYGFDRILTFEFARDDHETRLIAELFGEGNIAVLDEDDAVIDCLDTIRLQSRTIAPGDAYGYPDERFNPFACDFQGFQAKMEDSDSDLVRTLATQLNFGGLYAEELCTRADVEKTLSIDDATEADFKALFGAIEDIRTPILAGQPDAILYEADGDVVDVTPLPLDAYEAEGYDATNFETFNAAIDEYFYRLTQESEEGPAAGDAAKPDFAAEIAKQERIIDQQEAAIDDFDQQADETQEKAERLYAQYDLVDDIISTVQTARADDVSWSAIAERFAEGAERGIPGADAVIDVTEETGMVTIEIDGTNVAVDPSMGVEKNADRLYSEAKRIREKKQGAQDAIEETKAELASIKQRRDSWDTTAESVASDSDEGSTADRDYRSMASIPIRYEEQWYERFRWFRTSDGFLVLGGRNAGQNDELVKKYMEPIDRFLHTDAHGGPVTIIKASAPDEPARDIDIPTTTSEEAAQFAVSYSSVWKEGHFEGDVYEVAPEQVSTTPESGEYLEKGGFVVRGDREYYRNLPVSVAIGVKCTPDTRVIGGPPSAIEPRVETAIRLEPGRYTQNDTATRIYRIFQDRFSDTSFVRNVASADRIQEFCPSGGSRIIDE